MHEPSIVGRLSPTRSSMLWWGGAALLLAATVLVYAPAVRYDFVNWDDDKNVLLNDVVVAPDGLKAVWSQVRGPQGFPNYPLFYTSLWLEYRCWGAHAAGYHATNIALHALNTLLLLGLLRRLGLSRLAAWLSTLAFALHPVQVESVAWITERKNVLSGTFYLLAFLAYARYRMGGPRWAYPASLAAFVAALLSKAASVSLAPSLMLADVLLLSGGERLTRESLGRLVDRLWPFVAAGLVVGMLLVGAEARPGEDLPLLHRPLIAAAAAWFYVLKLLAPVHLIPIYPRWSVDPASLQWWLPLVGLILATLAVYRWRARLGRHVLWGLGHFLVTLSPAVGLVTFAYLDVSFVADRFLYLACVGLFVAIAVLVESLVRKIAGERSTRVVLAGAGCAAGIGLAVLSARQLPVWRDSTALWTYTVQHNDGGWMAHHNLGSVFFFAGRNQEALQHWRRCLEINPRYPSGYVKVAVGLSLAGDYPGAADCLHRAVKKLPRRMVEAALLEMSAATQDPRVPQEFRALVADAQAAAGYWPAAVEALQRLIQVSPTCALAYDRLAWIRATCPLDQWRNGPEAVRLAEKALRLAGDQPGLLGTLAAAYAEAGRFGDAAASARRAVELARQAGDQTLAAAISEQLAEYERRQPYRQ